MTNGEDPDDDGQAQRDERLEQLQAQSPKHPVFRPRLLDGGRVAR